MTKENLDTSPNDAKTINALTIKRVVWIFIVYIISLVIIGEIIGFFIGVYIGISEVAAGNSSPLNMVELMYPYTLLIDIIATFFAALIMLKMVRHTLPGVIKSGSLASLGWRPSSTSITLLSFAAGCVVSLIFALIFALIVPPIEDSELGPMAKAVISGGLMQYIYWVILALVIAPPVEEFFFRGVLFTGLTNTMGVYNSAAIVSCIFIIIHEEELLSWAAWIGISLLAILTIFLRIKTKSLVPAIAAHFGYNLIIVVNVGISMMHGKL